MRGFRAVSGHFSLSGLLQLTSMSAIGTVLREPRSRIMSLYAYWRVPKIFDQFLPYSIEEYVLKPLGEFLAEPHLAPAVDNQLCRMLLYGDPLIPNDAFIAERDVEAIASRAITLLERLGFVGVLELGDSAWHGLARLFGFRLEARKLNVTGEFGDPVAASPGERLFTADTLDLIEQRSSADRIVYEHALGLAGVRHGEALRLAETAFADQLFRLRDLLGEPSAQSTTAIAVQLRARSRDRKVSLRAWIPARLKGCFRRK